MLQITGVVKQLLLINVFMFIVTKYILPEQYFYALAIYYPASPFFYPWQIVTHMFMHGGFGHLFFNMFGLYMFGTALENYFGPKRFLTFYLLSGLGALAIYMGVLHWEASSMSADEYRGLLGTPMLGASGAIFGLLAGFGMTFPNTMIMLLIPPIPMKAKYFVIIFAALELYLGLSRSDPGVANFAHVGGAIFGALIILYWRKSGFR